VNLLPKGTKRSGKAVSSRPVVVEAIVLILGLSVTSCGSSPTSTKIVHSRVKHKTAVASTAPAQLAKFISVNASMQEVTFTVVAAYNSNNGGFNFDGFSNGNLVFKVPVGWKVTIICQNHAKNLPHSCSIVPGAGTKMLAFGGASSPNPTQGVPPGGSQTFSFTPNKTGTFRIACLVPGHEEAGMWDTFLVTSSGTPALQPV